MNDMKDLTNILVVDDEPAITDLVGMALKYEGFAVKTAAGTREARQLVRDFHPELIVLDIGLPMEDGFEFTKKLKSDNLDIPILFLTARDSTEDKIHGLSLGGDDYVTKPFSVEELVARIRAILRRRQGSQPLQNGVYKVSNIELNEETYEVRKAGNVVELTRTEFSLLRYLMINAGRVLSRGQILDHVWSYDFEGDASVLETYISYLRKKLDKPGENLIQTIRGIGYVIRVPRAA